MHVKVHAQWERNTACQHAFCTMTSFDHNYQNALRQAIVFSIFSFMKNRSCVTQIYITKIVTKCILVFVVKKRDHTNVFTVILETARYCQRQDESRDWYLHCLIALLICIVRLTIKWPVMWMLHLHPSAHRKRMTKTLSSAAFSTAVGTEYRTIPTKRRKLFVRTS